MIVWGRNIRANLIPAGEAAFRPPLFMLPAFEAGRRLDEKAAEFRLFPGSANFFTQNTLPSPPPGVKHHVMFFTKHDSDDAELV